MTDTFLDHPMRAGLVRLLREHGAVTATDAAGALGCSSGLASFHLRQLARRGLVEEVAVRGRAKPWRLVTERPRSEAGDFGDLARGLEDESYQRWRAARSSAPPRWQRDEAFSAVLYLAPAELPEVAEAIRGVLAKYADREHRPLHRPHDAAAVAVLARLFPLLPASGDEVVP